MSSITEAEPSGLQSTSSHRHVIPLRRKRPIAVPNFDSDSDSGSDALSLASNARSKTDHASGHRRKISRRLYSLRTSIRHCVKWCCKVISSGGEEGWIPLGDSIQELNVASWMIGMEIGKEASPVPIGAMSEQFICFLSKAKLKPPLQS
jgi:hypothetical protein